MKYWAHINPYLLEKKNQSKYVLTKPKFIECFRKGIIGFIAIDSDCVTSEPLIMNRENRTIAKVNG